METTQLWFLKTYRKVDRMVNWPFNRLIDLDSLPIPRKDKNEKGTVSLLYIIWIYLPNGPQLTAHYVYLIQNQCCIQFEMYNVKHLLLTTSLIPVTSLRWAPHKNPSLVPRPSGNFSNIEQLSNSFFFRSIESDPMTNLLRNDRGLIVVSSD